MPTAYTSLLGLALPVTGELQGTWGQTVNDAITSLLDTAVAGTTTLSTDADVTLTTTTGASNQARQAIILWTANGTTTRNITAPAQSKAYVVINASAGTQSIVIRGVGPTTGVTVAKGEKVLVAWNGSDFVRVAAYGGTGEFTTVDTTNLEVTNVKAKDGTSAATIADSTGVVTFTANPILNGGTANGVLYLNGSKVATSGSALVFDGSNLGLSATPSSWSTSGNIDVPDSRNFSTQGTTVGINTNAYFNVNWKYAGTGAATRYAQVAGTHQWYNATSGTAGNTITFTEQMRIAADGSVGIGTSSPTQILDISAANAAPRITSSTGTNQVSLSFINTGGNFFVGRDSSTGGWFGSGTGYTSILWSQGAYPMALATNNTERMRITSAGNVGIGTTTPAQKLHVDGGLFISGAATLGAAAGPGTFSYEAPVFRQYVGDGTGYSLAFSKRVSSVTTDMVTLTDTGIITIGPTATAGVAYNLSITNASATQAANTGVGVNLVNPYTGYPSGLTGARLFTANEAASGFATYFAITTLTPGGGLSERMRITSNGNVGIGTSTVAAANALEIARGSTDAALISTRANGNSAATEFAIGQGSDGTSAFIYNRANGIMAFATNNTERMRIAADGNVGIGITPSAWAGGLLAMQVSRGAISGNTAEVDITHNANYDSAWKYIGSTFATRYYQINGAHSWQNAASGTAGAALTWTERMVLDANGYLGVGVSPTVPLAPGSASPGIQTAGAVVGRPTMYLTGNLYYDSGWKYAASTSGALQVVNDSGVITWSTAPSGTAGAAATVTERMRLTSGGRLVVGGTTASNAAVCTNNYLVGFEVNSATTAYYQWYVNNAPTDKKYWRAGAEAGNGNWYLETVNDAYSAVSTKLTLSNAGTLQLSSAASSGVFAGSLSILSSTDNDVYRIQMGRTSYYLANVRVGRDSASANSYAAYMSFETTDSSQNMLERLKIDSSGNVLAISIGGLGYGTGSGGAVTQGTSRTQGVTLDKTNGAITLFSAAGTTTWQSFTVTNNKVAATDTVIVNQKSGTDLYEIHVTAVAAGSFRISFKTTGGTTTEQPVFNFAVIKAVTA